MDPQFNIAYVADRLNLDVVTLWAVPVITVLMLWVAQRLSTRRSSGIIFYRGGNWMAEMARFSFAATLTLSAIVIILRANPGLQTSAGRALNDIGVMIYRAFQT